MSATCFYLATSYKIQIKFHLLLEDFYDIESLDLGLSCFSRLVHVK